MASAPTSAARATDALRALRERFRETSAGTIATFEAFVRVLRDTPGDARTLAALRHELHRVHGTAGSYGFMDASLLAEKLEGRVARWESDLTLEQGQRALILGHFVSALRLTLAAEAVTAAPSLARRRMLLVDVGSSTARTMRSGAALRGYHVSSWRAAELSPASLREHAPHVLVSPATSVGDVLLSAAPANVPVIALRPAPLLDHASEPAHAEGPTVSWITESSDWSELFDVADRLCLGTSSTGATILVVDDDPSILAIVQHLLESEGVRITTCDEPRAMHHILSTSAPSLLLLDLRLGDHSGIDVTRELRALPAYRDLPVVLVSVEASDAMREAARLAGVDDFLAKPISAVELRECIAGHLERQRMRRLSEGRHPGTGLPLPRRTAAEAARFVARARDRGAPAVVAIIRPDVTDLSGDVAAEWLRETQRIAHAVSGGENVVGYHDGVALIAVAHGEGEVAESLFEALAQARDVDTPLWRCGIADVAEHDYDLHRSQRAAEDAIEVVRQRASTWVNLWRRDDAQRAPDVIVVEDDVALSEMLQYVLRLSTLSYRAFVNGDEALEALLAFRTDGTCPLLLLDVDLPGLDGHALHERLRTERPGQYATVFITAHATEADQVRALQAGALDYVPKPVSYRTLMGKVPLWRERAGKSRRATDA